MEREALQVQINPRQFLPGVLVIFCLVWVSFFLFYSVNRLEKVKEKIGDYKILTSSQTAPMENYKIQVIASGTHIFIMNQLY